MFSDSCAIFASADPLSIHLPRFVSQSWTCMDGFREVPCPLATGVWSPAGGEWGRVMYFPAPSLCHWHKSATSLNWRPNFCPEAFPVHPRLSVPYTLHVFPSLLFVFSSCQSEILFIIFLLKSFSFSPVFSFISGVLVKKTTELQDCRSQEPWITAWR